MPERERLTAILRGLARLLGAVDEVKREVETVVESSVSELMLRELYTIRPRQIREEEMIEEIAETLGLSRDSHLLRLLREAGARGEEDAGDRSG